MVYRPMVSYGTYGIYGTIWYIRYHIVWYGMVWYSMVPYGMVWYGTIWYIPYHMVYVVYMVPMVTYGIYDRYL